MPRTEEANQRIREVQRAKILEAAWKVFARHGLTATMASVSSVLPMGAQVHQVGIGVQAV
jgi:hypothetical protein